VSQVKYGRVQVLSVLTATIMCLATMGLVILPASRNQTLRAVNASSEVVRVSIAKVSYVPDAVTVPAGTTVVWTNDENDGTIHSVTGGDLASPDLSPGLSYSYTFPAAGTYTYHCRFHSYMQGTVTATAMPGGTTTTPPSTAPPTTAPTTTTTVPAPPPTAGTPMGDGTYLAPFQMDHGVKVFHLDAAPVRWEVKPGEVHDGYAYNGVIPGPIIRVNEGDRVRMLVKDDLPEPTTVHWHGMVLPNQEDGVPDVTQAPIQPGQTYTYEWTAVTSGTHWYHSHFNGGAQVGKGLYGPLQIVPKGGDVKADHDYSVMIGDQNLGFVFNGKSWPATTQLKAKVGERVHIRLYGAGDDMHPIHLHGADFEEIAQDGQPLATPQRMDTLTVSAGQTFDLLVVPTVPGKWLFHCHRFSHSETTKGMSGLVTILDVAPK
jgi:FtsP/CotA-like multicopper oxidase with cupredoxin domain